MTQKPNLVKPFAYAPPEERKAKAKYLMALRGLKVINLHKLLGFKPVREMVGYVLNGKRKSARLEERIATVLGVTREELFGNLPLRIWRMNGKGVA